MAYKTCENCGSRVFEYGCVNCDEMEYISMQDGYEPPKPAKVISSNPVLCDENCDPFFIKTDEYGYCKKCFKNLGFVRK